MSKRILIISGVVISVVILAIFGLRIYTKSFSPEATAAYKGDRLNIQVDYCRPSKNERDIFGDLLPYGEVWRTGANEATLITFDKPVIINGARLDAGKYSLFSIPQKDHWTIIFNNQTGQWGTIYNQDRDALRIDVPSEKSDTLQEVFTIDFKDQDDQQVDMILKWDSTIVHVPIALAR